MHRLFPVTVTDGWMDGGGMSQINMMPSIAASRMVEIERLDPGMSRGEDPVELGEGRLEALLMPFSFFTNFVPIFSGN